MSARVPVYLRARAVGGAVGLLISAGYPARVCARVCVWIWSPDVGAGFTRFPPLGVGVPVAGRPASGRSKCLHTLPPRPAPNWPGLLRARPRWGGPGVCVLGGVRGGRPGPRAGRGLGGPAQLTSGDSLNSASSALGSAFREEPERGPRQRHRPARRQPAQPRRPREPGMGLRARDAWKPRSARSGPAAWSPVT